MEFRMRVADRFGRIINEITPKLGAVSWRLVEPARAEFTIARTDPKLVEENFQYGNRVIVDFPASVGLPPWGGTIELPTTWTLSDAKFTAYTIERKLDFRQTDKSRYFNGLPAGRIIELLLLEMELDQSEGVTIGSIFEGGRTHHPHYHFTSVWEAITMLRESEFIDTKFTPYVENGHIFFRCDIYEELGSDKSGRVALKEGQNVSDIKLMEQGTIENVYAAVGAGQTWGDERVYAIAEEYASRGKYGKYESSRVYSEYSIAGTIERLAQAYVAESAYPRVRIQLGTINKSPALFGTYEVGDHVRCVLPSYRWGGFDSKVRVLARELDVQTGKVKLVLEEDYPTTITTLVAGTQEGV